MSSTRVRVAAQDAILGAIVAALKAAADPEVAKEIGVQGAMIAKRFGATHPDLPASVRQVAS
jgi:hypothetical protein